MPDMIPIECTIGYDDNGDFWVRMTSMDDPQEVFEEGPFDSRETAERWCNAYMESLGAINMGWFDDMTKH